MNQPTQTAADCPRCGFGTDAKESGVCPLCQAQKQSVTHYGISNAIDAPDAGATGNGQRATVLALSALVLALLAGFFLIVRESNRHLDAAVARMERASR